MISPDTAPGTGLIVIWVPQTLEDAQSTLAPHVRPFLAAFVPDPELRVGRRVALDFIHVNEFMANGYSAHIQGIYGCYPLECFDIATLPEEITSLLTSIKEDDFIPA